MKHLSGVDAPAFPTHGWVLSVFLFKLVIFLVKTKSQIFNCICQKPLEKIKHTVSTEQKLEWDTTQLKENHTTFTFAEVSGIWRIQCEVLGAFALSGQDLHLNKKHTERYTCPGKKGRSWYIVPQQTRVCQSCLPQGTMQGVCYGVMIDQHRNITNSQLCGSTGDVLYLLVDVIVLLSSVIGERLDKQFLREGEGGTQSWESMADLIYGVLEEGPTPCAEGISSFDIRRWFVKLPTTWWCNMMHIYITWGLHPQTWTTNPVSLKKFSCITTEEIATVRHT